MPSLSSVHWGCSGSSVMVGVAWFGRVVRWGNKSISLAHNECVPYIYRVSTTYLSWECLWQKCAQTYAIFIYVLFLCFLVYSLFVCMASFHLLKPQHCPSSPLLMAVAVQSSFWALTIIRILMASCQIGIIYWWNKRDFFFFLGIVPLLKCGFHTGLMSLRV